MAFKPTTIHQVKSKSQGFEMQARHSLIERGKTISYFLKINDSLTWRITIIKGLLFK